jgi:transposase
MSGAAERVQEVNAEELAGIVERAGGALSAAEHAKLKAATSTLVFLTAELKTKGVTIERLKRMLFGGQSETTRKVLKRDKRAKGPGEKTVGHGKNGAAAYTGADREQVKHAVLQSGTECGGCQKGKLYPLEEPAVLVRVTGMAPLSATVWECERLRCNLCGEVFTAPAPAEVGEAKYDEEAAAMTGLLKYGCGLPFNRTEKLQAGLGIPLPAATQWELVEGAAEKLKPVVDELVKQAAQGDVLHNDDTTMKVLELSAEQVEAAAAGAPLDRTGVFTTGVISVKKDPNAPKPIALFFTGRQHAGENLEEVMKKRAAEMSAPIQMSDALAANTPGELKTIVAKCLAHARREFVEVANDFPAECQRVLETLSEVYRVDADAREQRLQPDARLELHQEKSAPRMNELASWLEAQVRERKVEPNSGLGRAITYMRKHWSKLTLFLRVPGAPLDNNIVERGLKKAILHRKNSLFYRTLNGARVGDTFMSIIHTVELHDGNPFDYLVAVLRHHEQVADEPAAWMPWNYAVALERALANP